MRALIIGAGVAGPVTAMALKRAGITRDTASPVKSLTIEKDGNGDPTGVFVEQEMQPITELLWFREATRFSHADRMKALQESQRLYHAFGTTGIFEGHGAAAELIRVYKQTHQDGALSMRTTLAFSPDWLAAGSAPLGPFVDAWAAWLGEPSIGDDRLRMSGVYLSLGQPPAGNVRTAAAGSYTGWAGFNYTSGLPRPQLKEVLVRCAANDIRVVMNGPPVLDLYDEIDREVPLKGKRWVIAHVPGITQESIAKFKSIGGSLSLTGWQFLAGNLPAVSVTPFAGPPFRWIVDSGIHAGMSSDGMQIAPMNPWIHMYFATTGINARGVLINPGQQITREQVLRLYTKDNGWFVREENELGSIEVGKLADLAVLNKDYFAVADEELKRINSVLTLVGGKIVHDAKVLRIEREEDDDDDD